MVRQASLENGAFEAALCTHWAEGGVGATTLADAVIAACSKPSKFKFLYDLNLSIEEKMNVIAKEMYGASKVVCTTEVLETIKKYTAEVLTMW